MWKGKVDFCFCLVATSIANTYVYYYPSCQVCYQQLVQIEQIGFQVMWQWMKSNLNTRRHYHNFILRYGFVHLRVQLFFWEFQSGKSAFLIITWGIPDQQYVFAVSDSLCHSADNLQVEHLSRLEFEDGDAAGGGGGEPGEAQAPPLHLWLRPHLPPRPNSSPVSIVRPPLLFRSCLGSLQCGTDWSRLEPALCGLESIPALAHSLPWTPLHVLLRLPPCAGDSLIWSPSMHPVLQIEGRQCSREEAPVIVAAPHRWSHVLIFPSTS